MPRGSSATPQGDAASDFISGQDPNKSVNTVYFPVNKMAALVLSDILAIICQVGA